MCVSFDKFLENWEETNGWLKYFESKEKELQQRIDKAIECIENKLSYETYQHLKKIYDDIDGIEEIWEDYEFDDLLDILRGEDNEKV